MKLKNVKYGLLITLFMLSSVFFKGSGEVESQLTIHDIDAALLRALLISPEMMAYYQDELSEVVRSHYFSGNVLVAINGKVVFEHSSGYADMPQKIPNNLKTVFQLASVSKQFTAMAVAILKEQGKLHYDDLVKKHIPEFPYDDITIRHLLCHTSGLQNYIWLLDNHWHYSYFPDNENLIDMFVNNTLPQNFRAGSRFSYSNSGYAFLGSVIERVSGLSYDSFLQKHIFKPLGMNNTYTYNKSLMDTLSNKAHGHVGRGRRYVIYDDDNNDGILGDKGIYSNLHDLFIWDKALYGNILLPVEAVAEMFQKQTTEKGDSINYGLGWRLPKEPLIDMVYHNGWWHGYRTTLRRFTNDRNTIIVLNNTNTNIFPMIRAIEKVIYPELTADALNEN